MAALSVAVLGSLPVFLLLVGPAMGSSRVPSSLIAQPEPGMCGTVVSVHGYKCEEYEATTDDGYILSVQRIPQGRNGGGRTLRPPPVLLQHGVLVDGTTWLLNSPEQSLAMILADSGFDVWISNIRGTRYSRRHVTLDANTDPGTLMALASFSEGRLVDKVKSAVLLSPIAYLSHMTTGLGLMAARAFVGEITTIFGLAEFNPKGEPVSQFLKALCAQPGVDCFDLMSALTGKNCCLNSSTVELFLKYEPQSTSTKNLVHLAQTVRDGILAKYDYGNNDFNLAHYGEARPPRYNLSNIPGDIPMFISYGGEDALSDVRDVESLLDYLKLHDVLKLHVQYIKDYAHADFIIGITAKDVVYNQIINFFRNLH
ncbi:PREDICTED: triacylglycerol lipase 2 isoform X2 [Ipomoea nil]|uniref:triacylglycerol lipase 2 isoform X2 n=1 Tax=Ipomoea nil TaxID=35883 RepID=UPI0009014EC7|nr:PREDICTED: triacylglycerol lipase 2 isoform X2 [Ipomoea nil]